MKISLYREYKLTYLYYFKAGVPKTDTSQFFFLQNRILRSKVLTYHYVFID